MQESKKRYQADVLIVGGGIAGIVAAMDLLDTGKKVLIFDRDLPERFGGLAKESFGGLFFVDSPEQRKNRIQDSPELAYQDWLRNAEFEESDHWPREWAKSFIENNRQHVYEWLSRHGVKLFPVVHWVERGLFTAGNTVPRFHMVWGTGRGLIQDLMRSLDCHDRRTQLTPYFRHSVEGLIVEGGVVKGIHGSLEDGDGVPEKFCEFEAFAEVTVLASGGISGDLGWLRKNWHPSLGTPPETILNGAHRFADGRMHFEAEKTGAKLTHLDRQWNYAAGVHHPDPKPGKLLDGLSLVPPKSALWMNSEGLRIGPVPLVTGYDTRFLVEEICKQKRKYSWQILNWKIALKELAVSGADYNDAFREKSWPLLIKTLLFGNKRLLEALTTRCKDFVVAHTLEELVEKMNALSGDGEVRTSVLREEVERYDRMIDRGPKFFSDDQLRRIAQARRYRGDRVRTCKFQKILDPGAGPLIAIREFILSRKTLGGIQTDLQSRALGGDGQPIPGLYAIGETAGYGGGGFHGKSSLEGTFLGGCIYTARRAAVSISARTHS